MDGCTDRRMEGRTDGWRGGQTDGWMDRRYQVHYLPRSAVDKNCFRFFCAQQLDILSIYESEKKIELQCVVSGSEEISSKGHNNFVDRASPIREKSFPTPILL